MSAISQAVSKMTNVEMWNAARKESPTFASHTSKATNETFTEKGYAEITRLDKSILNEFFSLSIRVALNKINVSEAQDHLAEKGFGEVYDNPWGGVIQRIAVDSIKPVNPAYKNLQDGQSVDPFVVRKPKTYERFYEQNFDYQSFITLQDFNLKQIFISEFGVSAFTAGILQGFENGWIIQKYVNKLQVLNDALHDDEIKPTQVVGINYSDTWTDEELKEFLLSVMNTITMMSICAQSSAFNMAGFSSRQDTSRLKLLVRAGFKNALKVRTLLGAFNPEQLNLGIDIIEVEHFGGITYQLNTGTPLYPAYDQFGVEIGLNEQEKQLVATHQMNDPDVVAIDPNKDVVAILADKGFMFETYQNNYNVEDIRNPRGKFENMFADAANNSIHYDRNYNFVVYKKATQS